MTDAPRLYYLDDIPTPYRLGVQRRIADEWEGAFKIAYCAESEPGRDWSFDFSGLDVEMLPGRQLRPPLQRNPFSFKWNPTVIKSIEAFRPDVVVLSGYAHPTMQRAARWCRKTGVPYGIVCESSCRNSHCDGWRWHVKRRLVGPMVRDMTFGLPVGREAGEYLLKLGGSDVPMHYFPNTPDTSRISAEAERIKAPGAEQALRREMGIPEGKKIILFAGRLIDAKRPLDAVEAFQRLDESLAAQAVLVIVGDGPLMGAIDTRAGDDERIICTGWMKDAALLARLMAISACLVLPSAHEPWGAVVNEAMAAGIPVIASDRVSAAVELVASGECGEVHPVGDVGAITTALTTILVDEPKRLLMGAAARRQAEAHGATFAVANFLTGTQDAVQSRPI